MQYHEKRTTDNTLRNNAFGHDALYVHSQEEYACDWIFNSIPQTESQVQLINATN